MATLDSLKELDYRIFLPAAARLPIPLAYQLADLRGWVQARTRSQSRQHAARNIAEVFPHLSRKKISEIVIKHFQVKSRDELEAFWYSRPLTFYQKLVRIHGLEELRAAVTAGKGVLFFSGHLGSLGLCWTAVAKHGIPMTIVARSIEPEENPLHPAALQYNRKKVAWIEQQIGYPFLLTRKGNYFRVRDRLRQGQVAMIAIDVLPNILKRTVTVDFMGAPAALADGIASLYKETEASLVQYTIYQEEKRRRQKIELRDVTGLVDRSASHAEIIQKLAHLLEDRIRRHPEQWHVWDSVQHYRQAAS